jgi:hypothetical protein
MGYTHGRLACIGCQSFHTPGELRVVQPPIHPRVHPTDNCGKFFVLCFHSVTFPRALCAQVAQASARNTGWQKKTNENPV